MEAEHPLEICYIDEPWEGVQDEYIERIYPIIASAILREQVVMIGVRTLDCGHMVITIEVPETGVVVRYCFDDLDETEQAVGTLQDKVSKLLDARLGDVHFIARPDLN